MVCLIYKFSEILRVIINYFLIPQSKYMRPAHKILVYIASLSIKGLGLCNSHTEIMDVDED